MRPRLLATLLLATALLCAAPTASAAAPLKLESVEIFSTDDDPLRVVQKDTTVELRAVVKNTGSTAFNGTVTVVFRVTTPGNRSESVPIQQALQIPNGGSVNVVYEWTATEELGNHSVSAEFQNEPATQVSQPFEVQDHAVLDVELGPRIGHYGWFYLALLVTLILFVAVVRLRGPRP